MTASGALIVTWNPDKGKWGERGDTRTPSNGLRGVSPQRWWTGPPATDAVEFSAGDRVFLLRQGKKGRGIIASGAAVGEIYQAKHWDSDRPRELANNVDVRWDHVVEVEDTVARHGQCTTRRKPRRHSSMQTLRRS